MLALISVAVSLGMTNFAGALAIGLSGVDARLRLRVALAFGLFEGGMPVVGLLLGREPRSLARYALQQARGGAVGPDGDLHDLFGRARK
jgi:putative Mn2+ efflux pump MntP